MKRLIGILATLVVASACSTTGPQPPASPAPAAEGTPAGPLPTVEPAQRRAMTFLNSSVFDRDLAGAMGQGYPQIAVDVAGSFSLDVIPERLERWLVAIQDSGGRVEVEALPDPAAPAVRSAELIALLQVAVSYFRDSRSAAGPDYTRARDYQARLYYERDSGIVRRMVFHRRGRS